MESKVLFLWDPSQSVRRLTAAEQAFLTECDPILHRYRRVCYEAHQEHLKCLSMLRPSERSDSARPHIIGKIIKSRMALAFPELAHIEDSGRFALHTKNYILLFNKLDEETLLPCFPLSKNGQNIKNQMTADGGDNRPVVFLGYTLSELSHEIGKVMSVYTNANKVVWKIDLDSIAGSGYAGSTSPLPIIPLEPAEPNIGIIEIKKKNL